MLGAIIGDIVGSTRERHNIKREDFELVPKGSHFTDDTVMTLAVAEWLMTDPEHQPGTLVACMQRLGRKYPRAGYGGMFSQWLKSDDPKPYNSFGNGSAMRVSPVGLYANSLEEALELARMTASVSHNHPEGIKGAQAIAACVYLKRNSDSGAEKEIEQFIARKIGYNLDFRLEDVRATYRFDVTCQGSVPIAIKAYLESRGFSAEKALRLAISMGGDSDTIGAMAASIACAGRAGDGFGNGLIGKFRALLPADLLNINDRFEAFVARPYSQSYESAGVGDVMMRYDRAYTPERISSLRENEVFVFGSNLAGAHGGGAARLAYRQFGAVWGKGVGLQGQTYAIPTMQGGVETIRPYVEEFVQFARGHAELTFFVTRIGCGIAGFKDEEIAPLFKTAMGVPNIILPKEFVACISRAGSNWA